VAAKLDRFGHIARGYIFHGLQPVATKVAKDQAPWS
jgi:hypothetical protein